MSQTEKPAASTKSAASTKKLVVPSSAKIKKNWTAYWKFSQLFNKRLERVTAELIQNRHRNNAVHVCRDLFEEYISKKKETAEIQFDETKVILNWRKGKNMKCLQGA